MRLQRSETATTLESSLMLYAAALLTTPDGQLRALAPDLEHCDLVGITEQELLPRLRLAIEGELTRLLIAGARLPDSRDGQPTPGGIGSIPGPVRWLTFHINLAHLAALARHQTNHQARQQVGR